MPPKQRIIPYLEDRQIDKLVGEIRDVLVGVNELSEEFDQKLAAEVVSKVIQQFVPSEVNC